MDLEHDRAVRVAAFAYLESLRGMFGEVLPHTRLQQGFLFEGQRVPLMFPQQGIFKPAIMELPISLLTTPLVAGKEPPYDDQITEDEIHYRYRGTDRDFRDNVGVRRAMEYGLPLVYFHGIAPGRYAAEWPVYVVDDNPTTLTFVLLVDDRVTFPDRAMRVSDDSRETARRYVTAVVQKRLHQRTFRQRVIAAYREHCAVCRLRHDVLLDAAHILPDGHPKGLPIIPNGIALCKLHHAAFDAHMVGITPDYEIHVREDVMEESDGPMLLHGLQGFHRAKLVVPHKEQFRPDRDALSERYDLFRGR